jgi:hypothetical protein
MEEDNRAYILNLENVINFIFDGEERNSDSEITEMYVMDEGSKNLSLSTKQMREVKSGDVSNYQTIRYDIMKMLMDRLFDIENEELTFGETVVVNTMLTEGLITEIKENDM